MFNLRVGLNLPGLDYLGNFSILFLVNGILYFSQKNISRFKRIRLDFTKKVTKCEYLRILEHRMGN